jgi:hypothetical protein
MGVQVTERDLNFQIVIGPRIGILRKTASICLLGMLVGIAMIAKLHGEHLA